MNEETKEILEDVKRHLDYVEVTKQASIRDNEMKAMYYYITNLQEELKYSVPQVQHNQIVSKLAKEKHVLKQENQKLVKELDTLRRRIITFINVFQDEKTFGLSYSDLKHLRGIANNNKFDIKVLDDKLTELKGGSK